MRAVRTTVIAIDDSDEVYDPHRNVGLKTVKKRLVPTSLQDHAYGTGGRGSRRQGVASCLEYRKIERVMLGERLQGLCGMYTMYTVNQLHANGSGNGAPY